MSDQYLSTDPWDLHRRADRDRMRHNEKLKEVIKENLGEIISQQDIITADDGRVVKVPVRGLELPRIRFDPNEGTGIGSGNGDTKPGDIIGRAPAKGDGQGKQAGQEPGVDFYEAEFTIEELAELVFEDLHLPDLKEKGSQNIVADTEVFHSIAKKGLQSNLDRKRTLIEAFKRNAREGTPGWNVLPDDHRYKTWDLVPEPRRNAVIFAMRDVSGSMGEFEAYICRSFYYWMLRFLRKHYTGVEIVFITCHTEAREVTEHDFFAAGDSGGTKLSAAYRMALDLIQNRFDSREWNIYPFLFSDGYNWGDQECVELVHELLERSNLVGYGEIASDVWSQQSGYAPLGQAFVDAFEEDARMVVVKISKKEDVWPALRQFFSKHAVAHEHA